jgi:hypothetical protein
MDPYDTIPGMMCFPRTFRFAWHPANVKPAVAPEGSEWVESCEPHTAWFVHAVQNRPDVVGRVHMIAGFVMGIVPCLGLLFGGMLMVVLCLVGGFGLMYVALPPALYRIEAALMRRSMRRGHWWVARPIAEPEPRFNFALRQVGA